MSKVIQFENHEIGGDRCFVIAEIGSNFNQSLDLAYEHIDAAKEAGADAVKFQSIDIDKLYHEPSQSTIDLHKKIDLLEEWHKPLQDYCKKKEILFFSSPTYLEAIDLLESLNVPIYKLASAQIGTFPQLVEKVAKLGKPVILSTGMASYSQLERMINFFHNCGNDQYVILHCNSIYPTPFDRVHLPVMEVYQKMFQCSVGFSDHTLDIFAPAIAVARGAKVIEKHFALSRKLPVPDASFSLEPEEFKKMVEGIRAAEAMLIPEVRSHIEPEENNFKNAIRTKLILNKDIKKGHSIVSGDLDFRRAKGGIDCLDIQDAFGVAKEDIKKGTLLQKAMITHN